MTRLNLSVENLNAWYGESHVVQGVSFNIPQGEAVSILGRNGAGKTTTLKSIMGLISRCNGSVRLGQQQLHGLSPYRVAREGLAYVPETRGIFPSLSVEENLTVVARGGHGGWNLVRIFDRFPRLADRRHHGAAMLSGGEQQMLAIARALMTNGKMLILDEPTEGLAPSIVDELTALLKDLLQAKLGILLVEQNFRFAMRLSKQMHILGKGKIRWSGSADDLLRDVGVTRKWLGV